MDPAPFTGGTISVWIHQIKKGDAAASRQIWDCYFERLLAMARKCLDGNSRAMADEDIVLSAFDSFFQRARQEQFGNLENRDDLWQVLALVTRRKAIDLVNYQKRRKRCSVQAADQGGATAVEELASRDAGADLVVEFAEEVERLLNLLKTQELRSIAICKLDGYSNIEIASQLGCTERTVERKLCLIRATWETELDRS